MRYVANTSIWYLEYEYSQVYWCWGDMIFFVWDQIGYDPHTSYETGIDSRVMFFKSDQDRSFFLLYWSDKAHALPGL